MTASPFNPTQRFSSRVENYVRHRPRYPVAVMDLLRAECGLSTAAAVADIGSGTGIWTELLLKNGNVVYGVEPNREMREAAERLLAVHPNFRSISGTAEATGLKEQSVEVVTVAQAFHWFEREPARREFQRILKPGGRMALLWNDRDTDSRPFLRAYEELVRSFGTDYEAVNHKQIDVGVIGDFFGAGGFKQAAFPNQQLFNWDGLKGRLLSSSYAPEPGHPRHEPMLEALRSLYEKHQAGGTVAFDYNTIVYYGRLGS